MRSLSLLLTLFVSVAFSSPNPSLFDKRANAKTTPPKNAIVVDNSKGRSKSSYTTVQAGVNALSKTTTETQSLFIHSGSYNEQVYVPPLKSSLTIQGYTEDASSYHGNTVDIKFNLAREDIPSSKSDDDTATLRQWNPNTKIFNINIHNTHGPSKENGQNLALSASAKNTGVYGCQLFGYQDTVLLDVGPQIIAKSLIVGAVDIIFGEDAQAWLDQVDIRTLAPGWVTASGRKKADSPSWFVIHRSTVAGMNSESKSATYLGRPWGPYARVVFQETSLGNVISPAGWDVWTKSSPNTNTVEFAEFNNNGPGSVREEGPRAKFSKQLTAQVSPETVLGHNYASEWWVDKSYLS